MTETLQPNPEQQEQKFGRFECEYRDADGNTICVAKFELDPNTTEIILPAFPENQIERLHELRSLVLESTDSQGRPIKVGVLSIANPHQLNIFTRDCAEGHYQYNTK